MQSPAQFRIECNAQTVNTDALLIFWNPEMEKQHGFFSTQIVQQVMEKLAENDGQNLPKTKLNPGQCVESPPFQWKKHDHSDICAVNIDKKYSEQAESTTRCALIRFQPQINVTSHRISRFCSAASCLNTVLS
uniref:Uncharacterized protein n=1 Tax=Caenorhabditis japonica TaxID=281687 RepID=A0A8R1EKH4_CAEJA